jgi:A/G-specific adenine glycosylase
MMELGATVCLQGEPRCNSCPVKHWCVTRGSLPTRRQPLRASRKIAVLLARKQERILLVRRPESASVMPGLWELPPAINTPLAEDATPLLVVRHAIMQTTYRVTVLKGLPLRHSSAQVREWIHEQQVLNFPLTGLTRKILRRVLSRGGETE